MHKDKFNANVAPGKTFVISFSCPSSHDAFEHCSQIEYKLFTSYRVKQGSQQYPTEFSHCITLLFDQDFYNMANKSRFDHFLPDQTTVSIECKNLHGSEHWKIRIPRKRFCQRGMSFSTNHIKLNLQLLQRVELTPENKKALKTKQRRLYEDNLYSKGFLFRTPEPLPKGLGRGQRKNTGGGKNFNAKYITSINQGGRFTPK